MDPASAIGIASAVLPIVKLIAKNVASLSELQSRYGAADLKVNLMIGQLSTVKAALNQMVTLLEGDHGVLRDSELIGDFSTSLGCVEAVVVVLDENISLVQRNAADALTIRSKVNFKWGEKTMDDYLNMLNNQIHALGLLLTALQCRTALEQSEMLQSLESRHVFDRVKDSTSSLLWLRDAESVRTYRSDVTEDLDTVKATFTFDREIFNSRVYQMATRSNMIQALLHNRRDVPNDASSSTPKTIKGTVSNAQSSPKHSNVYAIHRHYDIHTRETLRLLPTRSVSIYTESPPSWSSIAPEEAVSLKEVADLSEYSQLLSFQRSGHEQVTRSHEPADSVVGLPQKSELKVLLLGISNSGKTTLRKSMKIAFEDDDEQWRLSHKPDVYRSLVSDVPVMDCIEHDKDHAFRIMDSNYIPTAQDILSAGNRSTGLYRSQYVIYGTLCQFFDVGGTTVERGAWPLWFPILDINSVIFTLDVSCYDRVLVEGHEANGMMEQLAVWVSLVQSEWCAATNFIVLFTKTDEITPSKLEASPFSSLFPDYAGKADSLEDILQYLAWRLDTASKEWTTRRLVFCNPGSIWDSATNMAEVAVSALKEVARFQSCDVHDPSFFEL